MNIDRDALRTRLRALFLDELDEHVLALNHGLLALEREGAAAVPADLVNQMFRSAHSVKGAAHAAGVEPVAALCHGLETALARLRDSGAPLGGPGLEPLFAAVDALANAGRQLREAGEVSELPVAPLLRALSAEAGGGGPAGDPPAPVRQPPSRPRVGLRAAVDAGAQGTARTAVAAPARGSAAISQATVRVPATRLEALLNRAGEVLLACERMHTAVAQTASSETAAADRVLAGAQRALTDAVREAGMVPFSEACAGIDRVVRDVARGAGKQVGFTVEGGDVEIDRPILEGLHEPLLHLVRNAVDHGVELPEQRVAAGKPAAGHVTVGASPQGSRVAVTISDDGAGIDMAAVRAAAVRRGVGAGEEGDEDVLGNLVFAPGVSTAALLTEVSGRGVGLDAVRAGADALGGSVSIESRPGEGTRVTLVVPITRSVARVLLVAVRGETVALSTAGVLRMVRARTDQLRQVDDRTMLLLDGRLVPVGWLSDAVGMNGAGPNPASSLAGVVVDTPGGEAVLFVDELLSEHEAVIKPPPSRLAGLPAVLGATILPSGEAVLVLNAAASARTAMARARPPLAPAETDPPVRARRVLLVDDTLTTRTLERSILETAGYEVIVAVDGLHALELLEAQGEVEVDAVVSDVNMPRMDGLALCEALRTSRRFSRLPVVLVTSLASDEDRRRGVDVGADAYIAKSEFDQSMLLDTLSRLL